MSFGFINGLENEKPKKKFQKFEITSGIEKISVIIPFDASNLFEEKMKSIKPTKKSDINQIVSEFEGQII